MLGPLCFLQEKIKIKLKEKRAKELIFLNLTRAQTNRRLAVSNQFVIGLCYNNSRLQAFKSYLISYREFVRVLLWPNVIYAILSWNFFEPYGGPVIVNHKWTECCIPPTESCCLIEHQYHATVWITKQKYWSKTINNAPTNISWLIVLADIHMLWN